MITSSGRAMVVAALVLLGGGLALAWPELVVLGLAAVLALLLAAVWMAFGPDVTVTREIEPLRVTEGELSRGEITIVNRAPRRSPPLLAVEHVGGREVVVPLPSLAAGERATAAYPLPTRRRGLYTVGPLTIGHSDPFRLMRLTTDYATTSVLRVHPRVHAVATLPTGRSADTDGPTSSTAPRGGVAFHSLRPYEPGDDHRLIHAKSTARLGVLTVRHNVVPEEPRMMLFLDTSAAPYTDESFEHAVRIAASLAVAAADGGFPVELRTSGGVRARVEHRVGRAELLDALAGVARSADDAGLGAVLEVEPAQEGVALGVVTGTPPPVDRAYVSRVRRRFAMVTVVEVGHPRGQPLAPLTGALAVGVETDEDFPATWSRALTR